jgi:Scaffold domain
VRIAVIVLGLCGAAVSTADGLLWFDGARPSTQAHQAVEWLVAAESHGLVPADYDAGTLQQALTRATQGPAPAPEQIARLEQALTAAMQRYLPDRPAADRAAIRVAEARRVRRCGHAARRTRGAAPVRVGARSPTATAAL